MEGKDLSLFFSEHKAFLRLTPANCKGKGKEECLKLFQLTYFDGVVVGIHRNVNYTEGCRDQQVAST